MNFFDLWLKFMKWGLIITPPVMGLVFVALPIIDAVCPWSVAELELDKYGRGGFALCVGMSSTHSRTTSEETSDWQRSYLLLTKRELASITEINRDGEKKVYLDSSKWGFWIISSIVLALVWFSVRFSIPRITAKLKPSRIRRDYQQTPRVMSKA